MPTFSASSELSRFEAAYFVCKPPGPTELIRCAGPSKERTAGGKMWCQCTHSLFSRSGKIAKLMRSKLGC